MSTPDPGWYPATAFWDINPDLGIRKYGDALLVREAPVIS